MNVPLQDTTACKDCDARIVFAQTKNKSKGQPVLMPVDQDPDTAGNVLLTAQGGTYYAGVLGPAQAAGAKAYGQQLHLSHMYSCRARGGSRKRT